MSGKLLPPKGKRISSAADFLDQFTGHVPNFSCWY
jgi:hypothetical protein